MTQKLQPPQAHNALVEATRKMRCPHCRNHSFTAFDRNLPGGGFVKTLDRVRCLDCKAELAADDARAALRTHPPKAEAAGEVARLREALTILSDHFAHGYGDDTRHGVIAAVEKIARAALSSTDQEEGA